MSQIRTAKPVDVGVFPGCTFVIDDTPPITQCQEAQISEPNGAINTGSAVITAVGSFAGYDLTGKKVTVADGGPDDGTYDILSNTDDTITTSKTFTYDTGSLIITCHDAGQAYLTRNESSFEKFIKANSGAYTIKAGKVYTNLADPPMNAACSDTWNPA